MTETIDYITMTELKNLMKNAKAGLEIAQYMGELPTFVDELNIQADPADMSIQYTLMPWVEVTSNYIISGEAQKCQKDVAEFAERVMDIINYFDMTVDIQLTNPKDMVFSMFLCKNGQPMFEITT